MIQADFQQYYGLRLKKLLGDDGGYSQKEILSLIVNLPVESRFISVERGGLEYWGWSVTQYLLAALIDTVNDNTIVSARVAGAKRAKQAPRFYRPDVQKKKKTNQFRAIAARRIASQRRKKEGNG